MRKKYLPSNAPFVEAFHKGGKQRPTAIVIQSSNTTSDGGAALARATMWHKRNSPQESFHYVIDESNVYQCVPDSLIAYHTGSDSKGAIGINICSEPLISLEFWDDQSHAKVLEQTVELVAHLALAYKIPFIYTDPARWLKWPHRSRGGIIIKVEGAWPWATFTSDVRARITSLKRRN